MKSRSPTQPVSKAKRASLLAVVVLTAPLWLAGLLAVVLAHLIRVVVLYVVVWGWWIGWARRRVLFVYSESPNWKEYIENRIVPRLPANTVVLNWSERSAWPKFSLPVMLFRCFAGDREFNPIGLVFARFDVVEPYRFWQPFRDMKHGRPEALHLLETEFLKHAAE